MTNRKQILISALSNCCFATKSIVIWSLSCVWLFATPQTIACQVPLSMGLSRQEYWSGLSCPLPGDLPTSGPPALQADSLPEPPGKSPQEVYWTLNLVTMSGCQVQHQHQVQHAFCINPPPPVFSKWLSPQPRGPGLAPGSPAETPGLGVRLPFWNNRSRSERARTLQCSSIPGPATGDFHQWNGMGENLIRSFIHVRGYFLVKIQIYIKCLYICIKCFIYLYFHKGCFSVNLVQCLCGRGVSPWMAWLPPWALCANTLITLSLCTNLFLAGLGLYFCMWSFSSGGQCRVVENRLQAYRRLCHCGLRPSHRGDFSCCEARAPGAVWRGLPCSKTCGIFGLGIKPVSPALAGGFLATAPPDKSPK